MNVLVYIALISQVHYNFSHENLMFGNSHLFHQFYHFFKQLYFLMDEISTISLKSKEVQKIIFDRKDPQSVLRIMSKLDCRLFTWIKSDCRLFTWIKSDCRLFTWIKSSPLLLIFHHFHKRKIRRKINMGYEL